MKKITIKKLSLVFLSFLMIFTLTGCGGDNFGDSSDSFYVSGRVILPNELDLEYSEVFISVVNAETGSVGDIIELNNDGRFGFTVSQAVILKPEVLSPVANYVFNPAEIKIAQQKTVDFSYVDKDEVFENPINITSELDSTHNEAEGSESFELTLNEEGVAVSLQELIDNPEVKLDLTESSIGISDINGNFYNISLDLLSEGTNSHDLDLNNNILTLNFEEFAQELLNNSSLDVNFISREENLETNEVTINLKSSKEGELVFQEKLHGRLSKDGLFELLTQTYAKLDDFTINSSYVNSNIADLINNMPIYNTTNISIGLDNEASNISTNTSVIDDSGVIVGSGETDLSIEIVSDTGKTFKEVIKVIVN